MARHTYKGSYCMAPSLLVVQDALGALGRRALPPRGPVGPGGAAVLAGSMATVSSEAWTVTVAPVRIRPRAISLPPASMVAPVGN